MVGPLPDWQRARAAVGPSGARSWGVFRSDRLDWIPQVTIGSLIGG